MGQRFGVRHLIPYDDDDNWKVAEVAKKTIEIVLDKTGLDIHDIKTLHLTIQSQEADGERNVPDAIVFEVRGETKDEVAERPQIKPHLPGNEIL